MYRYVYLIGVIFFGAVIWLVLFIINKSTRKQMLIMSFLVGFLGPISEFWYKDYWQPDYFLTLEVGGAWRFGLESYIFGFLIGGIGAVAYEIFFMKKIVACEIKKKTLIPGSLFLIGFIVLVVLNNLLKINSIYASSIAMITCAIIIWLLRPGMIQNSFASGLLVAVILGLNEFLFFNLYPGIVERWWLLENISKIFILGVPIEELVWGFSWGMFAGPLYEFWKGFKLK